MGEPLPEAEADGAPLEAGGATPLELLRLAVTSIMIGSFCSVRSRVWSADERLMDPRSLTLTRAEESIKVVQISVVIIVIVVLVNSDH